MLIAFNSNNSLIGLTFAMNLIRDTAVRIIHPGAVTWIETGSFLGYKSQEGLGAYFLTKAYPDDMPHLLGVSNAEGE